MQLSDANPQTNKSNFNHFSEKGRICDQIKRHLVGYIMLVEVGNRVRKTFFCNPKESTGRCSRDLKVPRVSKILRKRLIFMSLKLQLVQKLHLQDNKICFEFCRNLKVLIKNVPNLLSKFIFNDETTC